MVETKEELASQLDDLVNRLVKDHEMGPGEVRGLVERKLRDAMFEDAYWAERVAVIEKHVSAFTCLMPPLKPGDLNYLKLYMSNFQDDAVGLNR